MYILILFYHYWRQKEKQNLSLALLGDVYLHYVYKKLSLALLFVTMTCALSVYTLPKREGIKKREESTDIMQKFKDSI